VKDVDLFTTTVIYGSTNERATLSNGSIASSRIINMARSKKAILYVYNKFSTDTPFDKIQLFEDALRKFIKARPREVSSRFPKNYPFCVPIQGSHFALSGQILLLSVLQKLCLILVTSVSS
jgi:small-conductance mechanosensitive channel